jgi:hypothetical protein
MDKDLRLALMTGIDIPIPECKLVVHQPRIEEIAFLGDTPFFTGTQTLCLYKSMFVQGNVDLDDIKNFQIFMMVMTEKETADKKECVMNVLKLLFPEYKILLTPRSLILQRENEESVMIDENNFEALQETLRMIFCTAQGPMDQQAFNPADEKAREIAEKLMRGRQRVAAQKGTSNSSVFVRYLSILSIGLKIPISVLQKYTMYQFYDLIERYGLYINWDIDMRVRLAGGKPDKHPEDWMKDLH